MDRIENDETHGKDELRVSADEVDNLEDEIGPNAHGDPSEGFESVVIELSNGREIEFSGYGGGGVKLDVSGRGINGHSCIDCGEEKHERALRKIRGGPENRAVYVCRECMDDNPLSTLIG